MQQTLSQDQPLSRQFKWIIAIFLLLYVASTLIHLGYLQLNGDEPRRAMVTIEMMHSGNYIRPTTMGWEYYAKPPVYNWLMSACMFLTGSESEFPVRLPSVIAILAWAFLNYRIFKKFVGRKIAAASSLFLLTSADIYFWGLANGGEIDIFYSFIVYMQVVSMFWYNEKKNWLMLFVSSYFFCIVGCLTKGFPSIVFEGLTLIALAVYNRSPRILFRWQHAIGILLGAALLSIYLYAFHFYGSVHILVTNLLKESFDKSGFGDYPEKFVSKSLQYPISFLKILLPWSLILLVFIKKRTYGIWKLPLLRFALLFIIFNIPVYWFTGHPRMRYAYMFIPFCMVILAYLFFKFREEYPLFIKKLFQTFIWIFIAVLPLLISLFFWTTVKPLFIIVCLIIATAYVLFYRRSISRMNLLYFGLGLTVLRLIFALVFIPVKYHKNDLKYDQEMATFSRINNNEPIYFYKPCDTVILKVDLKITSLEFGSFVTVPYLVYNIPYYYYRSSGHLVQFDDSLRAGRNYIAFSTSMFDSTAWVRYEFTDRSQNGERVMLVNMPEDRNR